jgi:hypothetical protein
VWKTVNARNHSIVLSTTIYPIVHPIFHIIPQALRNVSTAIDCRKATDVLTFSAFIMLQGMSPGTGAVCTHEISTHFLFFFFLKFVSAERGGIPIQPHHDACTDRQHITQQFNNAHDPVESG